MIVSTKFKIFFILLLSGSLYAADVRSCFVFDEKKLDFGTMYKYRCSDYDGNELAYEYVYLKDNENIIFLRDRYSLGDGLWIQSDKINSKYFMYEATDFKTLASSESEYLSKLTMKTDLKKRNTDATIVEVKNGKESVSKQNWEIEDDVKYPFFKAGNNISELNIYLRFLNINEKKLEIGIQDVWGNVANYTVDYDGEELINGDICSRYKLKRDGAFSKFLDKTGYIWFRKNDPNQVMVKYMLNQRIGHSLKNEMAVLEDVKTLTEEEWNKFVSQLLNEKEEGLGF